MGCDKVTPDCWSPALSVFRDEAQLPVAERRIWGQQTVAAGWTISLQGTCDLMDSHEQIKGRHPSLRDWRCRSDLFHHQCSSLHPRGALCRQDDTIDRFKNRMRLIIGCASSMPQPDGGTAYRPAVRRCLLTYLYLAYERVKAGLV